MIPLGTATLTSDVRGATVTLPTGTRVDVHASYDAPNTWHLCTEGIAVSIVRNHAVLAFEDECESCGFPERTDAACQAFDPREVCCDHAGETHGRAHSGSCPTFA